MNATLAAAAARDPLAATLIAMGEAGLAVAWEHDVAGRPYDAAFARWGARVVLTDPAVRHALAAVARSIRLWSERPERARHHARGALARQALIALRLLAASRSIDKAPPVGHTDPGGDALVERALAQHPEALEDELLRIGGA